MTRYETLCDKLERQIASGLFAPGQPLPSVRDIMKAENLGSATVQKSLSKLQSKGLLDRHPNRGFFVLPTQYVPETPIPQIGFIGGAADYHTTEIFRGISSVYEDSRYITSSFIAGNVTDNYDNFFDKIFSCKLSGIILTHLPSRFLYSHIEQFKRANVPIVLWGSEMPGLVCDRVCFNHELIASILAQRIVKKGYKNVRFLTTTDRHPEEVKAYFRGFHDVFKPAGVTFGKKHVHVYDPRHGFGKNYDSFYDSKEYVSGMLKRGDDFDMLVCCHENTAVGAIRAIEEAGLRVPEDIAVISTSRCDQLDHLVHRRITSYDLHPFLVGKIAGEMMMKRIMGVSSIPQVQLITGETIDGDTD